MTTMRGALITVHCDCGETRYLPYGEQWACEKCGRRWNTSQIPAEEYWGIMHEMRRYRLEAMGVALAVAGLALLLGFALHVQFILIMTLVFGFWFIFYMPRWRQKVRRRTRELPSWKLHPE
jgi:Flp pilus assembly protein TadB